MIVNRYHFTTTRDEIYEPFEEDKFPNRLLHLLSDTTSRFIAEANDGLDAWLDSRYGEG